MTEPTTERVEVHLDPVTARWLRGCAQQRGSDVAAAAARQLRDLALADAVTASAQSLLTRSPSYFQDMADEIEAAFAEATAD